jgi:hypothetical protein
MSEPKCWGYDGIPLLPKELGRYLSKTPIADRATGKKKGALPLVTELDLIDGNSWSSFDWNDDPKSFAAALLDRLITENGDDILGFPLVQLGNSIPNHKFVDFPFTLETWGTLNTLYLNNPQFLNQCFDAPLQLLYLELNKEISISRIELCSAILDTTITIRSWLEADTTEKLGRIEFQLRANSIEEILNIAAYRTLRSCGYEPNSPDLTPHDWAIALRLGLHESGESTLEAAASIAGLTRERIRQITSTLVEPSHENIRRWELPDLLKTISGEFAALSTIDSKNTSKIRNYLPAKWKHPFELLERIFHAYGHDSPYTFLENGEMVLPTDIRCVAGSDFLREIKKICREKCGDLGFFLKREALAEIVDRSRGLSEHSLANALDSCLTIANLPLGYAYLEKTSASKTTANVTSKMLSWAGRLEISEIVAGIERTSRFRKNSLPPPGEVLLDYFRQTDGFEVSDQFVSLNHHVDREMDTVEGKIALLIENSPGLVVSKSQVQEHFRNNESHSASVTLYLTYSPLLKSVGSGCIALVGSNPSIEDIADAKQLAKSLTVPSDIQIHFENDRCLVEILVGTLLRDTGTFAGTSRLRHAVGESKFQIVNKSGQTFGTLACSNGRNIYSLVSFFNARQIEIGDTLVIDIDFQNKIAVID